MGLKFITKQEFVLLDKRDVGMTFHAQSTSTEQTVQSSESGGTDTNQVILESHTELPMSILDLLPKQRDMTYASTDFPESSLSDWLKRPRQIASTTWSVNTRFTPISIYPWVEYFQGIGSAPLVKKLDNYLLFRGGLQLQIYINGSLFHYAKAYCAFRPGEFDNSYPNNLNPNTTIVVDNYLPTVSSLFPPLMCTYTQRPGVYIDPAVSEPVGMKLPFFSAKNYVDLRSTGGDLRKLGQIDIFALDILQHSNGALDPVTLTVLASIIDPVLSTPTDAAAFQGEGKDEYGKGVISATATALANFAGRLSAVPYIGKYAMATSMGASAVSSIAALFGFSRPIALEVTRAVRPRLIGNMANISGDEVIPKLSLDPKQELSIDPSTVGLDSMDHMAIAKVIQTESLLTVFDWTTLRAPKDILYAIKVHPQVFPYGATEAPGPIVRAAMPTALAWGTLPFQHWRGTIEYRVQIVCSQNHRGKLLIQYEPNLLMATSVPNLMTRYSTIVDITTSKDVVFAVNYNRSEVFLPMDWFATVSGDCTTSPGAAFMNDNRISANGCLIFSVFTELAAPIATSNVLIHVFVKAGDNFQVRNPTAEHIKAYSYAEDVIFAGESAITTVESLEARELSPNEAIAGEEQSFVAQSKFTPKAECENEPDMCKVHVMNGTRDEDETEDLKKIMHGEQIVSYRALLKRYNLVDVTKCVANIVGSSTKCIVIQRPNLPAGAGIAYANSTPTAVITAGTAYNFLPQNLLRYLIGGYVGWKGGIRVKYLQNHLGGQCQYGFINRDTTIRPAATRVSTTPLGISATGLTQAGVASSFASLIGDICKPGIEMVDFVANRVLEAELPYQSLARFTYCHEPLITSTNVGNLAYNDFQAHNHQVRWFYDDNANSTNSMHHSYVSIGEDFSLFFFCNAPIMYHRPVVTP